MLFCIALHLLIISASVLIVVVIIFVNVVNVARIIVIVIAVIVLIFLWLLLLVKALLHKYNNYVIINVINRFKLLSLVSFS